MSDASMAAPLALPGKKGKAVAPPRKSVMPTVLVFFGLTLLAAGCGGGIAYVLSGNIAKRVADGIREKTEKPIAPISGESSQYSGATMSVAGKPIVVNMTDQSHWIRVEGTFVMRTMEPPLAEHMATSIEQDYTGYLRSLSVSLVEGPSGLMHVREDLNDIARQRSNGAVSEFILETLVIQ